MPGRPTGFKTPDSMHRVQYAGGTPCPAAVTRVLDGAALSVGRGLLS